MLCPKCDNDMDEESIDETDDLIEIIFTCPDCGITYQGTLYRVPE